MKRIFNIIKNLFKIAKVLSVDDSGDFQYANVSFLGKTQKIMVFTPYGLISNPPANSLGLIWSQQGQESNGIGMADDPKTRPLKDLKEGESALVNHVTGDYVYLKENGDLKAIVSGNVEITASGNATLIATSVEITSTTLAHNGTNIGNNHIHPQGNDSDGDTEQDTGGPM